MRKISVLFVCLGNICRSPLAEGIFRDKVQKAGLEDQFEIDSCGTSNYHIGSLPDPRTRSNALENGIDLQSRGRQFDRRDFERFDYILPMDRSNFRNIQGLEPRHDAPYTLRLMREYDVEGKGQDVPDPYYGGERGFQDVFDILDRSTDRLLESLRSKHNL